MEEDTLAAELGMDSDEEFDTGRQTVDALLKVDGSDAEDEGIGSMRGKGSVQSGEHFERCYEIS